MTGYPGPARPSKVELQPVLSAGSALSARGVLPHHPITCPGELAFDEDGTFRCEHAVAPPGDERTRAVLNHSVGLLILELAHEHL